MKKYCIKYGSWPCGNWAGNAWTARFVSMNMAVSTFVETAVFVDKWNREHPKEQWLMSEPILEIDGKVADKSTPDFITYRDKCYAVANSLDNDEVKSLIDDFDLVPTRAMLEETEKEIKSMSL